MNLDKKLNQVERLTVQIHRLRQLLGDQDSLPNLILRPKGMHLRTFKRRIATLKDMERRRAELVISIAADHT